MDSFPHYVDSSSAESLSFFKKISYQQRLQSAKEATMDSIQTVCIFLNEELQKYKPSPSIWSHMNWILDGERVKMKEEQLRSYVDKLYNQRSRMIS